MIVSFVPFFFCCFGIAVGQTTTDTTNELCSPLKEPNVIFNCTYKGEDVNCNEFMKPGTVARYTCSKYYRPVDPSSFRRSVTCGEGGTWKDAIPKCDQECGIENPAHSMELTASNGNVIKYGKHPWHVVVHNQHADTKIEEVAYYGGTLINDHMVLTVTRKVNPEDLNFELTVNKLVFDNPDDYNITLSGNEVTVTAGKSYKTLDKQEEYQQTRRVSKVMMTRYHGAYENIVQYGIAILVTDKPFIFSDNVLPACIDYSPWLNPIESNTRGTVLRRTDSGKESSNNPIEEIQLQILNTVDCRNRYPSFLKFITADKICNPYEDPINLFPGSGMIIKQQGLNYIYGVVTEEAYNYNNTKFGIVTNVSAHLEWIKQKIDQHYPQRKLS